MVVPRPRWVFTASPSVIRSTLESTSAEGGDITIGGTSCCQRALRNQGGAALDTAVLAPVVGTALQLWDLVDTFAISCEVIDWAAC